jgi:hypothetical protein
MCGDSIVGGNKVTNFDAWYNNVFKFNSAKILDPNLDTLYFTRCITLTVKNLCFFFFFESISNKKSNPLTLQALE